MKRYAMMSLILASLAFSQAPTTKYQFARVYIEPQEGFESYIAKALLKKHVPLGTTQKKDEAQFRLAGTNGAHGFAGYGYSSATIQLIDNQTQEVVWTHDVRKYFIYGAWRSEAEEIAKELKNFVEAHPNEFEVSK